MVRKPNPTLVRYIEKHLSKGFHIKDIKKRLAEVGHPIDAIEDAASYVLASRPKERKNLPKGMVVYGFVLMIIIGGFAYFIWYSATEHIEYKEIVKEIKEDAFYKGLSEVDLLKLAASGDSVACSYIGSHNMYYACIDSYWLRDDCSYALLIGEETGCFTEKALEADDLSLCAQIDNPEGVISCRESVFEKIKDSKNPEVCGISSDCLDFYFDYTDETLDRSFCSNYKDWVTRERCLMNFTIESGDHTFCSGFTDDLDVLDCNINTRDDNINTPKEALDFCKENFVFSEGDGGASLVRCFYETSWELNKNDGQSCDDIFDFVESTEDNDFIFFFKVAYNASLDFTEDIEGFVNPDFLDCEARV